MCDPVTMGIAAGAASGYGAFAATAGTASAISAGTAIGIGLTVGTSVLQYSSMKQQSKLDEYKYNTQANRYKTEREQKNLQMMKDSVSLKRKYNEEYRKKLISQAGRGIDLSSVSYKAQFKTLTEDRRDDISTIRLSGLESMTKSNELMSDALVAKDAAKAGYKTQLATSVLSTGITAFTLGREFDKANPKPETKKG